MALVAFSPLGRAVLTDRPHRAEAAQRLEFLKNTPRFSEPNLSANLKITEGFRALAAEYGVPAAALAIAWLLHQGDHVIPIPGTRSPENLDELVRGISLSLSREDLDRINAVLPAGWAHGDRYSDAQWAGPERYC